MIDRLIANIRTAASLFMTGDARAARLLASREGSVPRPRSRPRRTRISTRLRAGRLETAETSALHLDALRDLKRVNTHIVAAAAYPVLENKGELLPSRLRQTTEETD